MEITNKNLRNNLLLGIDTGGTYTDGVLLDNDTSRVVAIAKTLTTRHDLTKCILKVLDDLLPDDPEQIRLVSISTTLATNAIAEGKRRPVALFLLGYDPEYARKITGEKALARASASGTAAPHLELEQLADGAESYRVRARAVGNPRLMK